MSDLINSNNNNIFLKPVQIIKYKTAIKTAL